MKNRAELKSVENIDTFLEKILNYSSPASIDIEDKCIIENHFHKNIFLILTYKQLM